MKSPSVHDILGTVEGLTRYAQALRDAAATKVHDIVGEGTGVLADPVALVEISSWMTEAAEELQGLIPNGPLVALGSKRRSRTLVRVVDYDPQSSTQIRVVLPGWNPDAVLVLDPPEELTDWLMAGADLEQFPTPESPYRLYAWVNIEASSPEDLEFSDWEVPKE